MKQWQCRLFALGVLCLPLFCVWAQDNVSAGTNLVSQTTVSDVYRLGPGDKVRVLVYGEEDLSGEYEMDGTGVLTLPLVGEVQAQGLSLRQTEQAIVNAYSGDYLLNPRVNVEVLNYRPVFIMGEVNTPGNYSFINGMTVLNAVVVAGGYTYRANKRKLEIRRTESDGSQKTMYVDENTRVLPGDVIEVYERYF